MSALDKPTPVDVARQRDVAAALRAFLPASSVLFNAEDVINEFVVSVQNSVINLTLPSPQERVYLKSSAAAYRSCGEDLGEVLWHKITYHRFLHRR